VPDLHGRIATTSGIRLIVFYKLGKAIVQVVVAAALAILRRTGATARAAEAVSEFAQEVAHGWTAALAKRLAHLLSSAVGIHLVGLALGLDAVVSAAEGWALHRRYVWAPWLVVVASGTLIPFELFELLAKPRVSRLVLLLVNLAIVAYLALRTRREPAA
jgi:uncharacterized membrane protein (DUF2068 family)